MRQYPIWNNINSCIYSGYGKGTGNKSYGVKNHSTIEMKAGASASNSFNMATIEQKVVEETNGDKLFYLYVDNVLVKTGIYYAATKSFECSLHWRI